MAKTVFIGTDRGEITQVQVGEPFVRAIRQVAEEAHYEGCFRVYLNGDELPNPEDAPTAIEAGMGIAITSYANQEQEGAILLIRLG